MYTVKFDLNEYYIYDECLVTTKLSNDENILAIYNTDSIDITETQITWRKVVKWWLLCQYSADE